MVHLKAAVKAALNEALLSLQFFVIILVIFLAEVAGAVVILVFKPVVGSLGFKQMCSGFNSVLFG